MKFRNLEEWKNETGGLPDHYGVNSGFVLEIYDGVSNSVGFFSFEDVPNEYVLSAKINLMRQIDVHVGWKTDAPFSHHLGQLKDYIYDRYAERERLFRKERARRYKSSRAHHWDKPSPIHGGTP